MFKKLINRFRSTKLQDVEVQDFTLEHCVEGVCKVTAIASDRYEKEAIRLAVAETLLIPVNKQRELRGLPALDAEHFANLYDQSNGSAELLAHLIYETGIGHR